MEKIIKFMLMAFLIYGCAGYKLDKILRQGKVAQLEFKATIPFFYVNGWIVIEVEIGNKVYNFLLDTGASNILTKETANELNLKFLNTSEIEDITGTNKNHQYGKIENIKIGGIDFKETIAAISDLNQNQEIQCTKIDGVIGSNLMSKAIWYFDFQKQRITITDDEKKLNVQKEFEEVKLFIGTADIPSIIVNVNGERTFNNTLDLGNAGDNILRIDYFENQKDNEIKQYIKSRGRTWGAFGMSEINENFDVVLNEMYIGNLKTDKVFAQVSNSFEKGNIGLKFLKNYEVILNWKDKKMKMYEVKKRKDIELIFTYGFSTIYIDGNLIVNSINENSSASKNLLIGDKILQINGSDYRNFSKEKYCDFLTHKPIKTSTKPILITILRDNKELEIELKKHKYFKKPNS